MPWLSREPMDIWVFLIILRVASLGAFLRIPTEYCDLALGGRAGREAIVSLLRGIPPVPSVLSVP